jgi:citrate lyase subunit beta/citryl-CoA lyase
LAPCSTSPSIAKTAPAPATRKPTPAWWPSLIDSDDNQFNRIGARVHDVDSPHFAHDVEIICAAAKRLAYIVLPKVHSAAEVARAIKLIETHAAKAGRKDLPVHVLIETHGALRDAYDIAALPQVQCLSFGIMDFVSAHYGAIPGAAMRTPGQFTHPLVVRAKLESPPPATRTARCRRIT